MRLCYLYAVTTIDGLEIVASFNIFKGLPLSTLKIIKELLKERQYASGHLLIEQGERSDFAYFILDGGVRIFRLTEGGDEISVGILGPGEIVGEMGLIDDSPRSASVITLKSTKALVLSRYEFRKLLLSNAEISINLLQTFVKRMRITNEQVEDISSKSLAERTWKVVQTLALYFPNSEITLSQEELASIIGASRTRVTETLNILREQGKIKLSHKKIQLL